jgi:DNA-binding HxlR family transcriptional regulator
LVEDHVPDTMKALSDVKSLVLFETVASSSPSGLRSDELNRNLRLTPKRLYSRISSLTNAGLVKKRGGRYFLTSYGRIIRSSLDIMNKASLYYTKLAAIDSIEASNINNNFPEEERKNIVQILVQNKQVRDILLNGDIKRSIAAYKDNESQGQSIPDFIIPQ